MLSSVAGQEAKTRFRTTLAPLPSKISKIDREKIFILFKRLKKPDKTRGNTSRKIN